MANKKIGEKMNIIFFTQEDPFYVIEFFKKFLIDYQSLNEIKAVVISRPMGKKSKKLAKQMWQFYGNRYFFIVGIKYCIFKLLGKRKIMQDNKRLKKTFTIKQLVTSYGIKILERSDLNSEEFLKTIADYDADLFISVASPVIFKSKLLKVPKLGSINIHNAPLPNYRGMLPNFWQLNNGESKSGITIHRIDEGIDTGEHIVQKYIPIDKEDSLHKIIIKTKREGVSLMIDVINDFKNGDVEYKTTKGEGSYYTFPNRSDVREFLRRGKKLF